MTRVLAVEHGCTSLLGLTILVLLGWGSWRFGYQPMFRRPFGWAVMGLALLDAVGLVFWSFLLVILTPCAIRQPVWKMTLSHVAPFLMPIFFSIQATESLPRLGHVCGVVTKSKP